MTEKLIKTLTSSGRSVVCFFALLTNEMKQWKQCRSAYKIKQDMFFFTDIYIFLVFYLG